MDIEANKESLRVNVEIDVLKSVIKSLHQKTIDYSLFSDFAKEFSIDDKEVQKVVNAKAMEFKALLLEHCGWSEESFNSL